MPELLTKHPDVTLQVLRSAGAQCGNGAPQEILKACPAQGFCKLPGGELCVYGLSDATRMTQITASDWHALLQAVPASGASAASSGAALGEAGSPLGPASMLGTGTGLLLIGVAIGWVLRRR